MSSHFEAGISPKEELNPKVVNNLFAEYDKLAFEGWNIRVKQIETYLKEGKNELAEQDKMDSYIHAILKRKAENNPRIIPLIDLFERCASPEILNKGFERVFIGKQIEGKHLEVSGTPAILGSGSPALLPYKQPPTSHMLVFDRELDQLQSMERFAAIVGDKVSIIDVYSDLRTPAIIPMQFLSSIEDPHERAEMAGRVSTEAGQGVDFNTGPHKKFSNFDELLKARLTDLCFPDDNDEINRYLKIMKYVEGQDRIEILGKIPLPELGSLNKKHNVQRVPVYGAPDSLPIYLDWNKYFAGSKFIRETFED